LTTRSKKKLLSKGKRRTMKQPKSLKRKRRKRKKIKAKKGKKRAKREGRGKGRKGRAGASQVDQDENPNLAHNEEEAVKQEVVIKNATKTKSMEAPHPVAKNATVVI